MRTDFNDFFRRFLQHRYLCARCEMLAVAGALKSILAARPDKTENQKNETIFTTYLFTFELYRHLIGSNEIFCVGVKSHR